MLLKRAILVLAQISLIDAFDRIASAPFDSVLKKTSTLIDALDRQTLTLIDALDRKKSNKKSAQKITQRRKLIDALGRQTSLNAFDRLISSDLADDQTASIDRQTATDSVARKASTEAFDQLLDTADQQASTDSLARKGSTADFGQLLDTTDRQLALERSTQSSNEGEASSMASTVRVGRTYFPTVPSHFVPRRTSIFIHP
jgi:hypothetical protein